VGKLSGLNESLAAIMSTRPRTEWIIPEAAPMVPNERDTALIDAIGALVEAVSNLPQANLEGVVKAGKGIKFPEIKAIDLSPIVEAISKIELEVEFPEHKPMEPCAYTFTIQRNDLGVATHIIAVPGVVEAPDKPDTASYE
jgi:hypothetical protein